MNRYGVGSSNLRFLAYQNYNNMYDFMHINLDFKQLHNTDFCLFSLSKRVKVWNSGVMVLGLPNERCGLYARCQDKLKQTKKNMFRPAFCFLNAALILTDLHVWQFILEAYIKIKQNNKKETNKLN